MESSEEKKVNDWLRQVEKARGGKVDLSKDEDLSIALMNLVSLEEHFYFTAMKTNDGKYLEMLKEVRELRTALMKQIVVKPVGEEWCISKHLLAASMRLIEVGTKQLGKDDKKQAWFSFTKAFELYSLFFAINLKLVGSKKISGGNAAGDVKAGEAAGISGKFSQVIKKIVDCCKEW
ncbi:hypothetical protein HY993_00010 [Candidatus Micrarchaeota archaeon]|nr:hypothetical protein [Candidatus Micrarchaeota archaeon]